VPRNIVNTISYVIRGENQLSGPTDAAVRDLEKVGEAAEQASQKAKGSFKELAGAYNAMIVAKKAAGFIGEMIKPSIEMQAASNRLAITTGLTEQQINKLSQAAMKAAEVTPFTPPEAIEGAKTLNLAIRDVDATARAMTPTLQLANTYLEKDIGRTTKAVSTIIRGFNVDASQLPEVMDKWIVASRVSGVQISDMDKGLKNLGIAAQVSGSSFGDIMPIYAMALTSYRDATGASVALRTAMMRLADPKIRGLLQSSLGVITEQGGRMLPVQDVFLGLADAASKNTDNWVGFQAVLDKAFGKKAIGPVIAAITAINNGIKDQGGTLRTGRDALAQFNRPASEMGGGLSEMTDKSLVPLEAQLQVLEESWYNLRATLLSAVVPALAPIAGLISGIVGTVRSMVDAIPGAKYLFAALATGAGILIALWSAKVVARAGTVLLTTAMEWLAKASASTTGSLTGSIQALTGWSVAADKAAVSGANAAKGIAAAGTAGAETAAAGGGGAVAAAGGGWRSAIGGLARTAGKLFLAGAAIQLGGYALSKIYSAYQEWSRRRDEAQKRIDLLNDYLLKGPKYQEALAQFYKEQAAASRAEMAEREARESVLIDKWFYATKELTNAAAVLGKKPLEEPAVLSRAALGTMESMFAKLTPEAQAKYGSKLAAVKAPFQLAAKGEMVTPEEAVAAQNALRPLGVLFKALARMGEIPTTEKDIGKTYKSLQGAFLKLQTGEGKETLDVLTETGYVKPGEYVEKRRKVAEDAAQRHLASFKAPSPVRVVGGAGGLAPGSWMGAAPDAPGLFGAKSLGEHFAGPSEAYMAKAESKRAALSGFDKIMSMVGGLSFSKALESGEYFSEKDWKKGKMAETATPLAKAGPPGGSGGSLKPDEALVMLPKLLEGQGTGIKNLYDKTASKADMQEAFSSALEKYRAPRPGGGTGEPEPQPF